MTFGGHCGSPACSDRPVVAGYRCGKGPRAWRACLYPSQQSPRLQSGWKVDLGVVAAAGLNTSLRRKIREIIASLIVSHFENVGEVNDLCFVRLRAQTKSGSAKNQSYESCKEKSELSLKKKRHCTYCIQEQFT